MKLLGAVLAGGLSTRFGSDKALALVENQPLIEHAIGILQNQCDEVCVVGRAYSGCPAVEDWPRPELGPLGGIAGALRYADIHGFTEVLTSAVDIPNLPPDLAEQLTPAPAYLTDLPVVGRWLASDLPLLIDLLDRGGKRAVRRFADLCDAHRIELEKPLANINTSDDLRSYVQGLR